MDPREAERRFAAMLDEAGLPRFTSSFHDPAFSELELEWDNGFTLHIDLTREALDPIDDWEREAILAEPGHTLVPRAPEDPRSDFCA
jgi:hypothetical protein